MTLIGATGPSRDSPQDPSERLNWHVFQQGGTRYLVADRMLMSRISWQDLDDAGYVFGTAVSIDGRQFRCRLMTGGDTPHDDPYQGAITDPMNGMRWWAVVGCRTHLKPEAGSIVQHRLARII